MKEYYFMELIGYGSQILIFIIEDPIPKNVSELDDQFIKF